ncbi:MAG: hydroxymethylbilane synthase [Chlamydiae bacterium]|nr:hydroxymethylbilane synthase [Chlamydiota bacterium]
MNLLDKVIKVGARGSLLSRKQVEEVFAEFSFFHPGYTFETTWIETTGDRDLKTSLRSLEKTDFFTKEVEALQCKGEFRISIHSAKDLPEKLQEGLQIVAITKGVTSADVLVFREGESFETLPFCPKIGSSSPRRDERVQSILPNCEIVDIRGTIQKRLELLVQNQVDAVVMAEAALLRLQLHQFPRVVLEGETALLQGKLAVVALESDQEMLMLFSSIDARFVKV